MHLNKKLFLFLRGAMHRIRSSDFTLASVPEPLVVRTVPASAASDTAAPHWGLRRFYG